MTEFLTFFIGMVQGILAVLNSASFDMFGYDVNFLDIVIAFLFIGFVISVFWRGAKA